MEYIGMAYSFAVCGGIFVGLIVAYFYRWEALKDKADKKKWEIQNQKLFYRLFIFFVVLSVLSLIGLFILHYWKIKPAIDQFEKLVKGG